MRFSAKSPWITFGVLVACFVVSTAHAGEIQGLGNMCLDVIGGVPADGTRVQIHTCHSGANQNWKFTEVGEIQVFGSKCLDIPGGQAVAGSPVQIFQCHGGPNQKWTLTENGEIRGLEGMCLDVIGGTSTSGTPVQLYACHGSANQRWQFVGRSLDIAFYIDRVAADQVTDGDSSTDRDEVYVLSRGSLPNGFRSERLPRYPSGDDYYEFFTGRVAASDNLAFWTNQDQAPVGPPVLWTGRLTHNQSGAFVVILGEQDNKDLAAIKQVVLGSLQAVGAVATAVAGPAAPAITAAVTAASTAAMSLPENTKDDVIGAFAVRLTNRDGELETVWLALPNIQIRQGESGSSTIQDTINPFTLARHDSGRETAVFNMSGTGGGSYRVAATVELNRTPLLTAWEYLGNTGDSCNPPQPVRVQGQTGVVLIDNQARAVRVQNPRFGWLCDSSQEWATCNQATNLVVAQRGQGDVLRWYCLRERSF